MGKEFEKVIHAHRNTQLHERLKCKIKQYKSIIFTHQVGKDENNDYT